MPVDGHGKSDARPDNEIVRKKLINKVNHQGVLNEMLALITVCKMDVELKMILRMRIWGKSPHIFYPMNYLEIAQQLKCKVDDVKRWEKDATHNLKEFLVKRDMRDILDKFKVDNKANELLNLGEKKRIII